MTEASGGVQNTDLIGFRVWERVIERVRILRQLYDLQAFETDPFLSQIPFIEETAPGPNGPMKSGPPLTLSDTRTKLLEQLSLNSQSLRSLIPAYVAERSYENVGVSVESSQ
jgi:hypothetical protein